MVYFVLVYKKDECCDMSDIRLLIVDDNVQIRTTMHAYFSQAADTTPIGMAADGEEALALRPDVVLLDIVMPICDGFCYLERLKAYPDVNPNVIVVSAIARDELIGRAIDLGACFYMLKPVNYDVLHQRVLYHTSKSLISPVQVPTPTAPARFSVEAEVEHVLRTIGVPPRVQGYAFVREAVRLVFTDSILINHITKELYPLVAKRFSTTAVKVERSIRHAIEVTWTRQSTEQINSALGRNIFNCWGRPSNGEFIACVVNMLPRESH